MSDARDLRDFSGDEVVLHLIATGLIRLTQRIERQPIIRYPYPDELQRGLNKLVVICHQRGKAPPHNVPELLDWCRRPLQDWPLAISQGVLPGERLLDESMPTTTCDAWACISQDVEADLMEQQLMQNTMGLCRTNNSPDSYVAFRKLLITKPVITQLEYQQIQWDPQYRHVCDVLEKSYEEAPVAAARNGIFHCCPICNSLLLQTTSDSLVCEQIRCRSHKGPRAGRTIPLKEGVFWLTRGLRRFVFAPGLAELRLAEYLQHLGVQVDLWPQYDAYDLRLQFDDGEAWAVDVKDWANPVLLARQVEPIPQDPPWSQAYYIFPDERKRERPDYARAFRNHCRELSAGVKAMFERDLLCLVRQRMGGLKNA